MIKTYKLFAVLFIACALTSKAFADEVVDDLSQFKEGADKNIDEENFRQQQQFIEEQRAKLWACYFLTRNKLFSESTELGKLLQGTTGESLLKRMTTDIMKNCLDKIQTEETHQILNTLNGEDFKIDDWKQLHGFNIESYKGENVKLDLEADETLIYDYYQKIDESVKQRWEEEAEKEDRNRRKKIDYEPQIVGLSLKETSPFVKSLYTFGVLGAIGAIFFFAYKKLFSSELTPYEKAKKQKLEKKRGKSQ